jgi:hypothetical protein
MSPTLFLNKPVILLLPLIALRGATHGGGWEGLKMHNPDKCEIYCLSTHNSIPPETEHHPNFLLLSSCLSGKLATMPPAG